MGKDDLQAYALTETCSCSRLPRTLWKTSSTALLVNRAGLDIQAFVEARAALPDRRFASVYADHRQVSDVLGDNLLGGGLPLARTGGLFGMVSPLMDSAEDYRAGK